MISLGYDEALGVTLTNRQTIVQFIETTDPIRFLTDVTSIEAQTEQDDEILKHPSTSDEIKHCLKDLKVRCPRKNGGYDAKAGIRSLCCFEI